MNQIHQNLDHPTKNLAGTTMVNLSHLTTDLLTLNQKILADQCLIKDIKIKLITIFQNSIERLYLLLVRLSLS